ncbi:MAG: P-II family nitrogen regulator [Gammaproteobacteria bacterium]|nr:P-II family nitrogen regulator [Gammaproteobacteria bacterium]
MKFKLIIAITNEKWTSDLVEAAKGAGATGVTIISHASGEGVQSLKTFLGAELRTSTDLLFFLVEEHLCRNIIESIHDVGNMDEKFTGIAFRVDVEDAVGVTHQIEELTPLIEDQL